MLIFRAVSIASEDVRSSRPRRDYKYCKITNYLRRSIAMRFSNEAKVTLPLSTMAVRPV